MNITWDAQKYAEDFSFVHRLGEGVMDLIEGGSGQLVVDLGCGNGALSKKLQERGYHVIGVEPSLEMLEIARRNHPEIEFYQGDARDFSLREKANVIFSNAVFHWIDEADQERMIANIAAQLVPGGQLVCEFGGKGCAEKIHLELERCFAEQGLKYQRVFYFPTIGEYAPLLEKHGLRVEFAALFDRPTPQKGPRGVEDWIRMFLIEPFKGVNEATKDTIIAQASERLRPLLCREGQWFVDYVRIRLRARKLSDQS